MPGAPELLVILAIVFLVFGASRLPNLARSLGRAKNEFHEGMKEGASEKPQEAEPQPPAEADKTSDGAQS
jgi:sec-independent protein translocase protein TatA